MRLRHPPSLLLVLKVLLCRQLPSQYFLSGGLCLRLECVSVTSQNREIALTFLNTCNKRLQCKPQKPDKCWLTVPRMFYQSGINSSEWDHYVLINTLTFAWPGLHYWASLSDEEPTNTYLSFAPWKELVSRVQRCRSQVAWQLLCVSFKMQRMGLHTLLSWCSNDYWFNSVV